MDTKTTDLVPQDPFLMMERLDEEQILDEIKGRAIDTLVYEIRQGGQVVTGLSLSGVREVARMMNANNRAKIGVTDKEPIVIETDEHIEVRIYAQDVMNGGGWWGIKRQPKKYIDRDGNEKPNPFAYEQALAKAQRNAVRGLIPEWYAREMIATFRGSKARIIDNQAKQQVAVKSQAEKQTAKKPSIKILTREYNTLVKEIGALTYYQQNGQPDTYHIIGAVGKLGYTEITDANIAEVKTMLVQYAKDQVALKEAEMVKPEAEETETEES